MSKRLYEVKSPITWEILAAIEDEMLVPVEPVLIITDDWTPVDGLDDRYRYAVVRLGRLDDE